MKNSAYCIILSVC